MFKFSKKKKDVNNKEYYLKDIEISDKNLISEINNYESIMNNESEVVFLSINKMIIERYKDSL